MSMQPKNGPDLDKLRGGYYTPPSISDFLVDWSFDIDWPDLSILEPSCGDGVFIESIHKKLDQINDEKSSIKSVTISGTELVRVEHRKAKKKFNQMKKKINKKSKNMVKGEIQNKDFFSFLDDKSEEKYNLILGNPPYIRYHNFENGREKAEDLFKQLQIKTTRHANAWLYFLAACVSKMNDISRSRIGMVVPAELLHITYSQGLRKWLTEQLNTTLIIAFDELVFPDVQQEVVLLLGERNPRSKENKLKLLQKKNAESLSINIWDEVDQNAPKILNENDKWNCYFLEENEMQVYRKVSQNPKVASFDDLATVKIGIVTGANKFFCVSDEELKKIGLNKSGHPGISIKKIMGRSNEVSGIDFNFKDYENNCRAGKRTNLIYFHEDFPRKKLKKSARDYLGYAESEEIHLRYKCEIRDPWYTNPDIRNSPVCMFKRAGEYNRLILNSAEACTTDTVHRIYSNTVSMAPKQLCFSFINSLTFLSCELEGRNYGGGVLELVPGEIRKLRIPKYACSDEEFDQLDKMFRKGESIEQILKYTDEIILNQYLKISNNRRKIIHQSWKKLQSRRRKRGLSGLKRR